jgi:hypothetical protein
VLYPTILNCDRISSDHDSDFQIYASGPNYEKESFVIESDVTQEAKRHLIDLFLR